MNNRRTKIGSLIRRVFWEKIFETKIGWTCGEQKSKKKSFYGVGMSGWETLSHGWLWIFDSHLLFIHEESLTALPDGKQSQPKINDQSIAFKSGFWARQLRPLELIFLAFSFSFSIRGPTATPSPLNERRWLIVIGSSLQSYSLWFQSLGLRIPTQKKIVIGIYNIYRKAINDQGQLHIIDAWLISLPTA